MGSIEKNTTGIGSLFAGRGKNSTDVVHVGDPVSAAEAQLITDAILDTPDVARVIQLATVHLSETEVLVGARIDVPAAFTMGQVSVLVAMAERRIQAAYPTATQIFLTPDVWVDPEAAQPTTSAIVMLSGN